MTCPLLLAALADEQAERQQQPEVKMEPRRIAHERIQGDRLLLLQRAYRGPGSREREQDEHAGKRQGVQGNGDNYAKECSEGSGDEDVVGERTIDEAGDRDLVAGAVILDVAQVVGVEDVRHQDGYWQRGIERLPGQPLYLYVGRGH